MTGGLRVTKVVLLTNAGMFIVVLFCYNPVIGVIIVKVLL